jgi:hypothetical protein|tara:strand:- start:254 stop:850 length:597 start_codon:yes stop_codon:yes gene_type:complete
MAIAIDGDGTITGISVGGLPDGIVDTDMIAAGAVTAAKRGAGAILQVKQTVKTDIFSTTSNGFNDVTGLTVTITPTSSSSKILAMCYVNYGTASDDIRIAARIVREESGSDTIISQGDADGNRVRAMWIGRHANLTGAQEHVNIQILDSPSSTNALTYKFQTGRIDSGTLVVNDGRSDDNLSTHARPISTITVMEVAG